MPRIELKLTEQSAKSETVKVLLCRLAIEAKKAFCSAISNQQFDLPVKVEASVARVMHISAITKQLINTMYTQIETSRKSIAVESVVQLP